MVDGVSTVEFPHLDECFDVPLTDQEKHLAAILEIVQVEKHVPKSAFNQWLGRKLEEREALSRAFVAKLLYRHPTTRDLIRALRPNPNLRKIVGFETAAIFLLNQRSRVLLANLPKAVLAQEFMMFWCMIIFPEN